MPEIGQSQIIRSPWYDRNPLVITRSFSSILGPHAAFAHWIYTVPANRKCMISSTMVGGFRFTNPSVSGEWLVSININNASELVEFISFASNIGESFGIASNFVQGNQILLSAGDAIRGFTSDVATGGSVRLAVSMGGTEFDA